jgi:D-alanyl-D-alanine carboxypeptidase (penicillin-binding protein 5/6)
MAPTTRLPFAIESRYSQSGLNVSAPVEMPSKQRRICMTFSRRCGASALGFASRTVFGLIVLLAAMSSPAHAQLFETKAARAFMIDAETGTVLFSKNADAAIQPGSLAKLMTLEIAFDALKTGRLTLDDTFAVSENAWRTGGAPSGTSTMFAALKSSIRLEDLIRGIAVQAANDGCIVFAEGFSGSEENFARLMNDRARQIGLTGSAFANSTGLPAPGQQTTARDLATLALHLWRDYPTYYHYFGEPAFTWNKITQRNRNPLLTMDIGADGLALGASEQSGLGLVGSAARDGRRVFVAMSGFASDRERAEEARKLIEWGLRAFEKKEIFPAGAVVGYAEVYGGAKSDVSLGADGPVEILLPIANRDKVAAHIVYQGPLTAPVKKGQPVGDLQVRIGDTLSQKTPLHAMEGVGVGSLPSRAADAATELATGWLRGVKLSDMLPRKDKVSH